MPGLLDLPGPQVLRSEIQAQATAGNADSWVIGTLPFNAVITGVKWIPDAAVTGAATNNFAFQLLNKGPANAGTGAPTTVKTYASGTNSVINTPEAYTMSTTATDINGTAGDVLVWTRTVNGTGLASPRGQVEVTYQVR